MGYRSGFKSWVLGPLRVPLNPKEGLRLKGQYIDFSISPLRSATTTECMIILLIGFKHFL